MDCLEENHNTMIYRVWIAKKSNINKYEWYTYTTNKYVNASIFNLFNLQKIKKK